jgi:hypothetical protein
MLRGYNFLMYNDVLLEVVKLVSHKREAVYDKPKLNYQYTRHTLVVRAILSAKTSEHILGPNRYKPDTGVLTPTRKDGNMLPVQAEQDPPASGLESDNAVRHALMAPRRRLYYVVGGDYVIDSPHGDAPCDATFGPIPIFCHIEKIAGMSAVSILFCIQTDITQCPLFKDGETLPPVVWHEYSQDATIDEKFLTTLTTKGEIRVRADAVAAGLIPDRFREYFAQACPAHYKRESIRIVQHPDMQRLEYVIVDKEQERPIINNGYKPIVQYQIGNVNRSIPLDDAVARVAKLRVKHTVGGGRKFTDVVSQIGGVIPEAALNPFNGIRQALGAIPGMLVGAALQKEFMEILRDIFLNNNPLNKQGSDRVVRNLQFGTPTITERIDIQVIGNPASTRYELELIAMFILFNRAPLAVSGADNVFRDQFYAGGSINFTCTHDVMANDVSMTFEYTRSAPLSAGIGAVLTGDDRVLFGPMISGEQSIVGPEMIPAITLHSYSSNHNRNPLYNVPASTLNPNVHNPWGRFNDLMHGTDPREVRVDSLHEQCEAPHEHYSTEHERGTNIGPTGQPMARQPFALEPNLLPPTPPGAN